MRPTIDYLEATIERADKTIAHYQRLMAGAGLTAADKRKARLGIIRAVMERAWAREQIEARELVEI